VENLISIKYVFSVTRDVGFMRRSGAASNENVLSPQFTSNSMRIRDKNGIGVIELASSSHMGYSITRDLVHDDFFFPFDHGLHSVG